jgi:signal transduction histidine kinase
MRELLRSIWGEARPTPAPARVWRDWALVGLLVPLALIEGVLRPDLPWRVLSVAVAVAALPMLLWRRTHPLLTVAYITGVTSIVAVATGGEAGQLYSLAGLLPLPYALYRWGSGREIVLGSALLLASTGLAAALGAGLGGFAVLFALAAFGAAMRYRVRARTRELERVRLLERERLAQEVHDAVAHHVSAMAVRAQAGLAVAAAEPGAAEEALRVIEAEAGRALTQMRAVVRMLRGSDPSAPRQPRRP